MASVSVSPCRYNSSTVHRSHLSSSRTNHYFFGHNYLPYISFPTVPLPRSIACLARRRQTKAGRPITGSSNKKSKGRNNNDPKTSDNDVDEDAFEALFKQLEEDLKNDGSIDDNDGGDEITEDDLALLENELAEALAEDEDMAVLLNATVDVVEQGGEMGGDEKVENNIEYVELKEKDEEDEEEDEEEEPLNLKGWQLRRLAYALKIGRRKTSIRNLADEVCLDRAIVLDLLREPPPKLLMMSAALPDKPETGVPNPVTETKEFDPSEVIPEFVKPEPRVKTPIHSLQATWSVQKRLKKVQVETLERVYQRSKRPTNAMISSIVQVTNLPRKRVLKWFEDRRSEEGVPEQRRPFQRFAPETVSSQLD